MNFRKVHIKIKGGNMFKKVVFLITFTLILYMSNLSAAPRVFVFSGYMDWTYSYTQNKVGTFDAYHFNPIFTVNFSDNLLAEAELEFEHGGDEIMVEYMKINWILNDYITFVGGKFLLPFGVYNDRIHPSWIAKIPGRPLANDKVVPVGWSDTGIMLTGAFGLAKNSRVLYSLYLVNGFTEDVTKEGDSTRDLRKEKDPRDTISNDKSFGGRLGIVPFAGTEIGVSGFQGRYAGDFLIALYGVDAEWHLEDYFEIRGEYNYVLQGVTDDTLKKIGYYGQAAFKLGVLEIDELNPFEVVLRYGGQIFPTAADNINQTSIGLNYFIGTSTVIRGAYHINNERVSEKDNNTLTVQFAMGF